MTPRVIYDCMIFLQALVSEKGAAFGCFQLVEHSRVTLCISPQVLTEVQSVLNRFDLQQKFPPLVPYRVQDFLGRIKARSQMFSDPPKTFALPRDPKDEPYINLAIAADARYLVTWNRRHLAYLMNQDTPEGRDFCRRFPDLKVLTPPDFLAALHDSDR